MCENTKLGVFAKVSDMSKYLRNSIKHMPKYERYDIGDEIRKLTRDMKYKAFLLQSEDCGKELYNIAQHLKILLDECIEVSKQQNGGMRVVICIKIKGNG